MRRETEKERDGVRNGRSETIPVQWKDLPLFLCPGSFVCLKRGRLQKKGGTGMNKGGKKKETKAGRQMQAEKLISYGNYASGENGERSG